MTIKTYIGDITDDIDFGQNIAVDTETMGLNFNRDRLCVIQLSSGQGDAHIVQIPLGHTDCPMLKSLFENPDITKIFHYARFDIAALRQHLNIFCQSVYCTKISSKLCRTYTDKHSLREICRELLNVDLNKQQQSSDWGTKELSSEQLNYAASDVFYLHQIKEKLDAMLEREGRTKLAQACFNFLEARVELDLQGWQETDIFAH